MNWMNIFKKKTLSPNDLAKSIVLASAKCTEVIKNEIDKKYGQDSKEAITKWMEVQYEFLAFERGFEEGEYSICQDIISKEKQGFVRPGTSSQTCVDLAIKKLNERQAEIDENNASMQEYQQNKY